MTVQLVLQQESVECGLACLAMILNSYGSNISLDSLRHKFDLSLRGTSVAELVRIAKSLKLDATVYLLKPNQLKLLTCPAILFWNGNHYVVLDRIDDKKGYHILDPATGNSWISHKKFLNQYSGYAITFNPDNDYRPIKENHLLSIKNLIRDVPKAFTFFWVITLSTLLLHVLLLLFPCYIQKLIDPSLSRSGLNETVKLSIFVLIVFKFCEALLHFFRGVIIGRWEKIFTEYIGNKVLKHLLYLPLSFFEKRSLSSIYSRFNSIDKTREILSRGFAEGLVDGIFSLFILIIIYIYNFKIGTIVSVLTLTYLVANYVIAKIARSYNQAQFKERSKEAAFLLECLKGIIPIKVFSKERRSIKKWLNLHRNHLLTAHKIHLLQSFLDAFRILIFGLQIAFVVLISLLSISRKEITLGMLYALLFYINALAKNVSSITSKWFDLKMLSLHAEDINHLLNHSTENNKQPIQIPSDKIMSIQMNNISFRYHKNEQWIIKNAMLTIKAGECVMLYGASGYGKSTLLKILMGLLQPTSGEILLNNVRLEAANLLSYRKTISAVMQGDELFSGTIYENISFFDHAIDIQKAHESAKLAGIADEIEAMPMKYHSYIGDMGVAISGGQKQRILLARALYSSPSVLFLDEAFSNLDVARERELTNTLKNLGLTLVVITHRQESLAFADKIIDIRQINNPSKTNVSVS